MDFTQFTLTYSETTVILPQSYVATYREVLSNCLGKIKADTVHTLHSHAATNNAKHQKKVFIACDRTRVATSQNITYQTYSKRKTNEALCAFPLTFC